MPQVSSEVRELLPGVLGEGLVWLWFHFEKLLLSGRAVVACRPTVQSSHFIPSGALVEMVNTPACHAGDDGFESRRYRHGFKAVVDSHKNYANATERATAGKSAAKSVGFGTGSMVNVGGVGERVFPSKRRTRKRMNRSVKVTVANVICNPWAGRKTLVHLKALTREILLNG